ncbi:putative membrane-associated protein [Terriglobus roseus DSM 18391]|uniref:Putative membrane-associated protein n=1 Tax=Terriglobus roseus (strain DSM 18391 / NRRL B-41598 / KBS 63) TaxID=926566 RepID=I3ZFI2_TERRK|nr:VTT domain-containing protein [Terriglobus roseus]AFL88000.1 putative membrane-associated protein [Terriglobus roseus DSM 18391]
MPIALDFFVHYAYGILFLWVLIEQLGVPVPSVPLLIAAGTLTATHRIHAVPAMLAILLACLVGDSVWYMAGVRYGGRVVKLVCRLSLEASACVKKTENSFGKHGATTLLFAKFIPGLSTVAPPIAGQTGMSYGRFLFFDLVGSLIWSSTYVFGGRFFGDLAERYSPFFHFLGRFGVFLFAAAIVFFVLRRIWRQREFLKNLRDAGITGPELNEMLLSSETNNTRAPFIVDLRHPLDYLPDPRVLPGAVRISPIELEKHCDLLPRDTDVILYCTCPNDETSGTLAQRLQKLGVHRVRPLRGGFEGWRDAGLPLVEYDETKPRETAPRLVEVAAA